MTDSDTPAPLWTGPQAATAPPTSQPLPPAGWHPDLERPGGQRYWDGTAWTEHRVAAPIAAPPPPAFCRACGQTIHAGAGVCTQCGATQAMTQFAPMRAPMVSAKQPVLAVVLSILLPGVGHLYAGDSSGLAITLLVLTGVEVFLSLTILLIPLAFIIWLPCAIWGAIDSRDKAQQWNLARGLPASGG